MWKRLPSSASIWQRTCSRHNGAAVDGRSCSARSWRDRSSRDSCRIIRHARWRWRFVPARTIGRGNLSAYGHSVRLIAPHYVKPFIKRQKNDAADAEAIAEAATRPTMRFVEPKTAEQQARAVAFRAREEIVKQRTEAINALRAHLYEFGHVAPEGVGYIPRLAKVVDDPGSGLPDPARDICRMVLEQIELLTSRLAAVSAARRVQGGRHTPAVADHAGCRIDHRVKGRNLRAADGPVPAWPRFCRLARVGIAATFFWRKTEAGENTKMGQRTSDDCLSPARWRWSAGPCAVAHLKTPGLSCMLERKPPLVAALLWANKMARGIWAMLTHDEDYRDPVIACAA